MREPKSKRKRSRCWLRHPVAGELVEIFSVVQIIV